MKENFRKAIVILAVFSLIGLAACKDPFETDEDQGNFTINFSTGNLPADDASEAGEAGNASPAGVAVTSKASPAGRAALYPPDLPDRPNPGAPKLEDLRFVVQFTRLENGAVGNGASKTITVEKTSKFKGKIDQGEYVVTMDVYVIKDSGAKYAHGVANSNPIKINGGYNDITIEAYGGSSAAPPVITARPEGAAYSLGATAAPLMVGVVAAKDGGTISYQWYSSEAGATAGGAPVGGNSPFYTPSTAEESALYYYCVVSNNKGASSTSLATNAVAVVVIDNNAQTPVIAAQPEAYTAITPGERATLSVSASVTDGGTLSYQWYGKAAAPDSVWGAIGGARQATYTTPALTLEGAYYYYCVITNTNKDAVGAKEVFKTSSASAVVVGTPIIDAQTPVIGTQPASANINTGKTATLSVSAEVEDGGTLSYQWYGGGASIDGASSSAYTTPALSNGTYSYYCIITNTNNAATGAKIATATSSVARVAVTSAPVVIKDAQTPVINSQPAGVNITNGNTATLRVSASVTDGGTLSYQWYGYISAVGSSGGGSISGATSSSYTTPTLYADSSYYCVITNNNNGATGAKTATVTSSTAKVSIVTPVDAQTPVISTQPASANITAGMTASLSVSASVRDGGTLSYQWYNGGSSVSGATSSSYTTPALANGTYSYSCVITNTNNGATGKKTATATSATATITVGEITPPPPPDAQQPVIGPAGQPAANTSISTGGTATLTVSASVTDGGILSFQWYSNAQSSNEDGSAIASATSASYTTPALTSSGDYYYYCVITNTNSGASGLKASSITTNVAKVTASVPDNAQTPSFSAGGQPAANTMLSTGGFATLTVLAAVTDGGVLSYQWYSNTSASNMGGSIISGATAASYTTPSLSNNTYYYYCVVSNFNTIASVNKTVTAASNVATVTVTTNTVGTIGDPIIIKPSTSITLNATSLATIISDINSAGMYVILDLSDSPLSGTTFNKLWIAGTGADKIVSLIVPNAATTIQYTPYPNSVSAYPFKSLSSVEGANITTISSDTFRFSSKLQNFDFPNTVTIGSGAFWQCSALVSVTIPNTVTSIGGDAFYYCSALANVTIGSSVTSIGSTAFEMCTALTNIAIPDSVTSIASTTFNRCSKLTAINVNSGNTAYTSDDGILYSKDETLLHTYPEGKAGASFTIPSSVTIIGDYAFYSCSSLTTISIPNSVTSIKGSAFSGCSNLQSVTIGSNVTSIGTFVFSSCSKLTSITIPSSVTSIGTDTFSNCSSLTAITVDAGNNAYIDDDGVLYNKDKTLLHSYPQGKAGASFVIPAGVTKIGESAFWASNLTSITIPNSVTSIDGWAFSSCTSLALVTCNAITPPTLGSSLFGFGSIPTNLVFKVPSTSLSAYQSATRWSEYASQIQAQ